MASKDIHEEPFDEGTKAKLFIFGDYVKSWLPVFLSRKIPVWKKINIFDFFAGPGADISGVNGTPLIIINELSSYVDQIKSKTLTVNLYFNEIDHNKYTLLTQRIETYINTQNPPFKITISKLDFKDAFELHENAMNEKDSANLILLDQNGIKHITPEIFRKIVTIRTTDFLFFISSSTIRRFSELPTIQQYINVEKGEVAATEYFKTHKLVLDYYRGLLPGDRPYYLAPFSIKKGANIYGLVFGSGHILGIEKFLDVCWKADPVRGEANFDIDRDNITPGQLELFTGTVRQPKKVEIFESELRNGILEKRLVTDKDVYLFSITNSFLPKHARKVLNSLVEEGKLKKNNLKISNQVMKEETTETMLELIENGN